MNEFTFKCGVTVELEKVSPPAVRTLLLKTGIKLKSEAQASELSHMPPEKQAEVRRSLFRTPQCCFA